jgi:hypothetical protein
MEESLHTSARIVVMWNSILKGEEMRCYDMNEPHPAAISVHGCIKRL